MKTENKIPKIIHFVWLGGEKSPIAQKCIESWKKNCPDFQIVEWNEKNFDVNSHPFVKEAVEKKKWAFASDYIRLWALAKFGGIYLDTDVEVCKDLTPFTELNAFFGFEHRYVLQASTFGCAKNHPYLIDFLKIYDGRHFIDEKGKQAVTPNTEILTALLKYKYGLELNNTYQKLSDGVVVFPNEYFCPKNYMTGKISKTQNTYCIHHFDGSWLKTSKKKRDRLFGKFVKIIGEKTAIRFAGMYYKSQFKKIWKENKQKFK